jgi:hypothetical protein
MRTPFGCHFFRKSCYFFGKNHPTELHPREGGAKRVFTARTIRARQAELLHKPSGPRQARNGHQSGRTTRGMLAKIHCIV